MSQEQESQSLETHSHKSVGGSEIDVAQLAINEELTYQFDPKIQGGMMYKDGVPQKYVRGPYWRPDMENPLEVHETDVRPVFIKPKTELDHENTLSGGELEMFVWNSKTNDLDPVMTKTSNFSEELQKAKNGNSFQHFNPDNPVFDIENPYFGFSEELAQGCVELNMPASKDAYHAAMLWTHALKKVAGVAESRGSYLTPISAVPHARLPLEKMSADPYVHHIAIDYMGLKKVEFFDGSSVQFHAEMLDLESALKAMNMYQHLSPLLTALSLASPFADGKVNPNLYERYQNGVEHSVLKDTTVTSILDVPGVYSTRYGGRVVGSPSGGVFKEPLPENSAAFYALAEQKMNADDIPSPARVGGHHTDRVRIDLGPHGTLEICNMDTFGGHPLKLAAAQEFTKILMWKLQLMAKSDRLEELSNRYPELFPKEVTAESLYFAHIASLRVSQDGIDAVIPVSNHEVATVKDLLTSLIEFVDEPYRDTANGIDFKGLHPNVKNEIVASTKTPPPDVMVDYFDGEATSVYGFYELGVGNLSYWLKTRAEELMSTGKYTEREAIENCMDDLGKSYHTYLGRLSDETIKEFFNGKNN